MKQQTSSSRFQIPGFRCALLLFTFISVALCMSTGFVLAVQLPVDLGSAENFVILTKSGITNVPTSAITGNIGTSPITGASITGLDCSEVTGLIYTVDATGPACRTEDATLLGLAIGDMGTAYTDAQGRTLPDTTELGAGDISGLTLTPGLHKWSTGLLINAGGTPDAAGVTLDCQGNASAVFIFQIAQDLALGNGAQITLSGGCQAGNIFWAVVEDVTLGTTSIFNGNILAQNAGGALDAIALSTGATLNGRAFAQKAVTLQSNSITRPTLLPTGTPLLTQIVFSPRQANLTIGGTQQFTIAGFDQYNASFATNVSYFSSNASLVSINETTGLATALGLGNVTLTATNGTVNGTTVLFVQETPPTPAPAPSSSSSSSGGGGGGCSTTWSCSEWNSCVSGTQNRTCSKVIPYCNPGVRPALNQSCSVAPVIPLAVSSEDDATTPSGETAPIRTNWFTGAVITESEGDSRWSKPLLFVLIFGALGALAYFFWIPK